MTCTALAIPFDRLERALAAWLSARPPGTGARRARPGPAGQALERVSIQELALAAPGPRPAGQALGLLLGLRTHRADGTCGTCRLAIAIHPLSDLTDLTKAKAGAGGAGAGPVPRLIAVLDDVVICQPPPAPAPAPAPVRAVLRPAGDHPLP
ncbi:hypothetical protein [Streptomyces sp. MNP-20]|uniref:hypothetical protein n=1 Tax=Streptomyces sp. MNP-20 TaxID=2721165 RepID=UPI00155587BF|nr:hypothetical protein [Streptomyces sp. MNP-20]